MVVTTLILVDFLDPAELLQKSEFLVQAGVPGSLHSLDTVLHKGIQANVRCSSPLLASLSIIIAASCSAYFTASHTSCCCSSAFKMRRTDTTQGFASHHVPSAPVLEDVRVTAKCTNCSAEFITVADHRAAATCSTECLQEIRKVLAAHRARGLGTFIDPCC